VNANGDGGPNLVRFRASVDAVGIRRLLVQAALSPANAARVSVLHLLKPKTAKEKL